MDNIPKPVYIPDYNAIGFGCGINRASCKEDCYWYREEPDMGAHIPYCAATGKFPIDAEDCTDCKQYHSKYHTTNADRIRAMTDEELADFMIGAAQRGGKPTESGLIRWLDWLREEAEEGKT